ncbi:hypothetical protein LOK49_LG08G03436 [Camellia lanceoleosa]|uniref:Uncharacterized protein n=1 Tax=Camellia lanceoleosa TaxID=1840588 RepID=A0ACC0GS43_9ERIC|nr:hypothetical protein LOK49_LG08G03436 [Camellia lanceoleosa]
MMRSRIQTPRRGRRSWITDKSSSHPTHTHNNQPHPIPSPSLPFPSHPKEGMQLELFTWKGYLTRQIVKASRSD